ncbi:Uma2 family endonuclease [Candidatus Cyanaurora vandensis]|uniref:Uma2 family endonuclease n=1 Tax=Candidatus Cyanaurora vandensis TaxID=2714958 RepID=UPI00257F65AA|nr:Uma2 family endonuclease [Candidatus Cyanaurora vandensis]
MQIKTQTLQEFLALPEGETAYELVHGQAIPKMSHKRFHCATQRVLSRLLADWDQGHIEAEWAVTLRLRGEDWVPCPDLTYIAYTRLPRDWMEDTAAPIPPDLVVEIISPGQTFGQLLQKAMDYLACGVSRVWVVDNQARSITVFFPDAPPRTYQGAAVIEDVLLPGLDLMPQTVFQQARLP